MFRCGLGSKNCRMSLKTSEYEHLYSLPDKVAVFHEDDPSLDTITIDLPDLAEFYSTHLGRKIEYAEAIKLVDGYGLRPEDQYFRHQEMPSKISNIWQVVARKNSVPVKEVSKEDVYNEIDSNRGYYKAEIKFIQREIQRKYIGYWFFNNGKPTYINGWHYFFLNYWWLDNSGTIPFGGKPKMHENLANYRDKQRRMSLFYEWAYTYKTKRFSHCVTFRENNEVRQKHFNETAAVNEFLRACKKQGIFAFADRGKYVEHGEKRTIAGVVHPKTRREGYTAFICCIGYCMITDTTGKGMFIQGLNFSDAKDEVFQKKIVPSVFNLQFFFSPYHDNSRYEKPADEYNFNYPESLLKQERAGVIPPALGSSIRPFTSKYRATDGKKGGVYYGDECGKTDESGGFDDIEIKWNNVIKRTLQVGDKLVGFGMLGSTVGDMSGGGGAAFSRLAKQSHYRTLSNNGTTVSELINVFFPAYDGMNGFIDIHGMSVVNDPSTPIQGQDGDLIRVGAKSHLQNIRDAFLKDGNIVSFVNETREMPFNWDEAWTPTASNSGMPIKEMRERLSKLTFGTEQTWGTYRLEWTNGLMSDVHIIPDPVGDWIISNNLINFNDSAYMNQFEYDYLDNCYRPSFIASNRMYMGVDPFAYNDKNTTGNGKRSKGAIAVFWKSDPRVDAGKEEKVTEDFGAIFNKRLSDKKLFGDECAKAAVLWGCHCNIESDVQTVIELFQEWKMDGYMLHNVKPDGTVDKAAGVHSGPNKQIMMTDMETFFIRNHTRIQLPQIIEEWLKLTGPSDLTNRDLCAASGWAVNAVKNPLPMEIAEEIGRQFFMAQRSYDEE